MKRIEVQQSAPLGSGIKIFLPEWLKDYSAIALLALFMFGAIWTYALDKYFLQILCSIGVAIIVATALNLVVGYTGQVSLGHAGFVALGGYATGMLLGRIPGSNNWIDYLYLRRVGGYTPDEQANPQKANAARDAALANVNDSLLIFLIAAVVLTGVFSLLFWLRLAHVKKNNGQFERHFWHSASSMRSLMYTAGVSGGLATIACFVLNLTVKLPSIITLLVLVFTLVLSYQCYNRWRKISQPNLPLRPGVWDQPAALRRIFLLTVILGTVISILIALFLFVGFWILQNFWVALTLGALVTGLFGYLLALPALRVKGPYLSMVTIAFGLIVREVVNSSALQSTLGSQNGLNTIPFPTSERNPRTDIIQISTNSGDSTFSLFVTALIILACAVATLYIIRNFIRSRWGRGLIALRENEIGAGSVGVNVTRLKTIAFVLSASLAGVAGVLNSYSFSFVGPSFSELERSVAYVTMLILGGVGTLFGPIIGAIFITILPEMLSNLSVRKVDQDVFTNINLYGIGIGLFSLILLAVLLLAWVIVRRIRLDSPGSRRTTRLIMAGVGLLFCLPAVLATLATIDVPSVEGTPNLFIQIFQAAAFLVGLALIVGIIFYSFRGALQNSPSRNLAASIGFVVIVNSIEIFRTLFNSIGSITGVGFQKTKFDISDWVIIFLYFVAIWVGFAVTISEVRRLAIRSIAAAFIMFIPAIFRLIAGLAHNNNGAEFRPTEIRLSIYGAILLYFLYLVPKGVGGMLGQFIEQSFPTRRRINYNRLQPEITSASADGGAPPSPAVSPVLAFHRQRGGRNEILRMVSVTRDFKGLRAVDSVDMKLKKGDIHALIGPNGAGKTTVLNLISGLYPVSEGSIEFCENRVDGLKPHEIAGQGISRTFQNLQVFGDMSVIENVMVGFHLHTKEGFWASLLGLPNVKREEERIKALAMQLLEFVGLGNRAYNRAKDLPYGYQRLLEIARALAVEPEILLLDEPAAGLNPHEIGDMDRLIRKIKNEGVTVLLIEHHMDLVMEISDEITVLDYGKKIAEGLAADIQNDQKVKDAYFGPEVVINARS